MNSKGNDSIMDFPNSHFQRQSRLIYLSASLPSSRDFSELFNITFNGFYWY